MLLDLWQARLDDNDWPPAELLPAAERERAAGLRSGTVRNRWVASRWALRGVLARYLGERPAEIELSAGERGKPVLASPDAQLRFNLSHSDDVALVAISTELEVGVDVERIGRRPAGFYAGWTRHEATVKCHGTGLGVPPPADPVAVRDVDAEPGYAAAVAVAGDTVPPTRCFTIGPGDLAA